MVFSGPRKHRPAALPNGANTLASKRHTRRSVIDGVNRHSFKVSVVSRDSLANTRCSHVVPLRGIPIMNTGLRISTLRYRGKNTSSRANPTQCINVNNPASDQIRGYRTTSQGRRRMSPCARAVSRRPPSRTHSRILNQKAQRNRFPFYLNLVSDTS